LAVLLLWAALHAALYNWLNPLWQAPDEPSHVEYACLLAQRGLDLRPGDFDPALQQRLIRSLAGHDFWPRVRQPVPDPLPTQFSDDPFLRNAGRQVGDESPFYYLLPALICRLPLDLPLQVHLMRLVSGGFFVLTVLAAWWAARAVWPDSLSPVVAVAAGVAGLPMLAFLGGAVSNDSLAALLGAITFGLLARWAWKPRWSAVLLLLLSAGLAALAKKTAAFLLPLAGLAVIWMLPEGWRRWRWRTRAAVILAGLAVAILAFLPSNQPADWGGRGQPWVAGRTPAAAHSGRFGARVVDVDRQGYGRLTQVLPAETLPQVRGKVLRFGAWVRAADALPQPVRLTVKDDFDLSQTVVEATGEWQWVEVTHTVSLPPISGGLDTAEVRVAVAPGAGLSPAETGAVDVDDARLTVMNPQELAQSRNSGGDPFDRLRAGSSGLRDDSLLRNGDFEQGTRWAALLLGPVVQPWLAAGEARKSATAASWQRNLLYLALLFPGFWGNFGWLQVPLPLPIYGLLAAICGLALAGLALRARAGGDTGADENLAAWIRGFSRSGGQGERPAKASIPTDQQPIYRAVVPWFVLGLALALAQTIAPMVGRDWQPQGRYLFPALLPLLTFLVVGLRAWSRRWRLPGALYWYLAGFLLLDIVALFGVLVPHYYRG
jgi:hypothetical protein